MTVSQRELDILTRHAQANAGKRHLPSCDDCGRLASADVLARVPNGKRVCVVCASGYPLPSVTPRWYRR